VIKEDNLDKEDNPHIEAKKPDKVGIIEEKKEKCNDKELVKEDV